MDYNYLMLPLIYVGLLITFAIAALHLYWVFGGKLFMDKVLPTRMNGSRALNPGKAATAAVAFVLFFASFVLAHKTGLFHLFPEKILNGFDIFFALVFLTRTIGDFRYAGLFRKITDTTFAEMDRKIFTPVVALLAAAFISAFFYL